MAEQAKGRRPVIPLVERLEIVRSVRYVDAAFVETVPDKLDTWKQVRFDVLFKGDDWRGTAKGEKLERDFATVGVRVVYFPYTVHTSSTQLRRALDALGGGRGVPAAAAGDPALAEAALAVRPAPGEGPFTGELRSVPGTT
jgi:glycerol-3-phosphate cytidylyltransferase